MRWVQHAAIRPHRCAVIPFLGNHNAKAGFFDTGQDMRDPNDHVYISIEAVEQMARAIGWELKSTDTSRVDRLEAENADLKAQLEEAHKLNDAAEYTLERFGTKIRNKPGRRPKVEA